MKKYMLAISLAALISLSACGTQSSVKSVEDAENEVVSSVEENQDGHLEGDGGGTLTIPSDVSSQEISGVDFAVSSEENTEGISEISSAGSSEISSEDSSSKTGGKLEYYDFKLSDGLSEKYVDFDNRSFVYEGKLYKLGETTLQDLIDGGLPFDEKELKNADNNVNPNYETARYTLDINDLTFIQLVFVNQTDESIPEKDCLLSSVRWNILYVPHDDYQDSLVEQIVGSINDCAEHISFSFPYYLTKDKLLDQCPDPTKNDEYGNVSYMVSSEVYMASSGYSFQFDKDTNQLKDVTISWIP